MNKKAILVDIGETLGSNGFNPIDFLSKYYKPFDRRLLENFIYKNKAKKVVSSLEDQFDNFLKQNNIDHKDIYLYVDNEEILKISKKIDNNFIPNEGAIDKINELSKHYEVAYISNLWQPYEDAFMREFESKTEGEHKCFFSHKLGVSKPDFKIFKIALNELGVEPEDVIMIGDSYNNDIAPAIELGIGTIWVLSNIENKKQDVLNLLNVSVKEPDLVIENFSDLIIDDINSIYYPDVWR